MQTDSIRIKIEPDGTIKLITDEISLAQHTITTIIRLTNIFTTKRGHHAQCSIGI